jgi:hypothetical protein
MRVGRHRFVAAVLVVLGLVFIGWKYGSQERATPSAAGEMTTTSNSASRGYESTSDVLEEISPEANDPAPSSGGVLRGRVVDAVTKLPIREFTIEFFARPAAKPTPGARAFQTKDGRFEWPNVPADLWEITASAAGYQRFEVGEVLIRNGVTTPEVELPLRRGFKITGRVFDELTRIGIQDASVSFREAHLGEFDGDWRRRERTSTDRDGGFVLEGVPAGRITLSVDSNAHATRQLTVAVGPDSAPLQIGLSAGGMLAGQLMAADATTPVAGWVGLYDLDRGFGSSAKTGPNGEFSYKNLPPGRYRLTGRAESGHVDFDVTLAASERMENIVLAISSGAVIRGVITGLSAKDLATASIATHREDDVAGGPDARIDSRGGYVLSGLRAGRVRIAVGVPGKRQLARFVDVPPEGQLTVDFNFSGGARLAGRITRGGKPWPWMLMQLEPVAREDLYIHPMRASASGTYAIDDLPSGDYQVNVGGYRSPVVRVDGDKIFDVEVPAMASFAGRVSEDPSGVPIVGARVDVRAADTGAKLPSRQSSTDHFGRFALGSLQPGDYIVTIYKPDFGMYRERVSFTSATTDRAIRLEPDRGVLVRVRSAVNGAPLRMVEATELIAGIRVGGVRLSLDEEGSAYLPSGLMGSSLSFTTSGFEPAEVRAWDGRELDLRLVPRR